MRPWDIYHARTRADSLECDRCKESDAVEWGGQAHNNLPPTLLVLLLTMQRVVLIVGEASHAGDRAHDERRGGRTGQILTTMFRQFINSVAAGLMLGRGHSVADLSVERDTPPEGTLWGSRS